MYQGNPSASNPFAPRHFQQSRFFNGHPNPYGTNEEIVAGQTAPQTRAQGTNLNSMPNAGWNLTRGGSLYGYQDPVATIQPVPTPAVINDPPRAVYNPNPIPGGRINIPQGQPGAYTRGSDGLLRYVDANGLTHYAPAPNSGYQNTMGSGVAYSRPRPEAENPLLSMRRNYGY